MKYAVEKAFSSSPPHSYIKSLCHFFLLYLMVDNVTRGKLALDIVNGNSHLNHKNKHVVTEIADLIHGFGFIVCLTRDNYLGTLLANLLEDLIDSLFKEIRGIRALLLLGLSALNKLHKRIKRKRAFAQLGILPYGIFKARKASRVASRSVGLNDDLQSILIAVSGNRYDVLKVTAGLSLEPKLPAGAAEKAGQPLFNRYFKALSAHVSQGEKPFCA